jgi:hypothetical protein
MSYQIDYVSYGLLSAVLPRVTQYFQKSEAWSRGRCRIDDIYRYLFSQEMQLWLVHNPELQDMVGYVITQIKQYPQCRMLVLLYCAGETQHMHFVEDEMYQKLEDFAKAEKCSGIEFYGRPGWTKSARAHGYTSQSIVYEKFFV